MSGIQQNLIDQQVAAAITKQVRLLRLGCPSAAVYYVNEQFHGHGPICEALQANVRLWESHIDFQLTRNAVSIIKLPMPPPNLATFRYKENKNFLIEQLPRFLGDKPLYSRPECRPEWWPIDLWSDKKRITKSGYSVNDHHRLIAAMYKQFANVELTIPPPKKKRVKKTLVPQASTCSFKSLPKRRNLFEENIREEDIPSHLEGDDSTQGHSSFQYQGDVNEAPESTQLQQLTNVQREDISPQLQPLLNMASDSIPSTSSHQENDYWVETNSPIGPSALHV